MWWNNLWRSAQGRWLAAVAVVVGAGYLAVYAAEGDAADALEVWSSQASFLLPLAVAGGITVTLVATATGVHEIARPGRPFARFAVLWVSPAIPLVAYVLTSWLVVVGTARLAGAGGGAEPGRAAFLAGVVVAGHGAGMLVGAVLSRALTGISRSVAVVTAAVGGLVGGIGLLVLPPALGPAGRWFDIVPTAENLDPWLELDTGVLLARAAVLAGAGVLLGSAGSAVLLWTDGRHRVSGPLAAVAVVAAALVVGPPVLLGSPPVTVAAAQDGSRCVQDRPAEVCWWKRETGSPQQAERLARALRATLDAVPARRDRTFLLTQPGITRAGAPQGTFLAFPSNADAEYWVAADQMVLGACPSRAFTDDAQLEVHAVIAMRAGAGTGYTEEATTAARAVLARPARDQDAWIDAHLRPRACDAAA